MTDQEERVARVLDALAEVLPETMEKALGDAKLDAAGVDGLLAEALISLGVGIVHEQKGAIYSLGYTTLLATGIVQRREEAAQAARLAALAEANEAAGESW